MNPDRRTFLAGASALALANPAAARPADAAAQANALFDRLQAEALDRSPERLTEAGLDRTPEFAWARSRLSDRSIAAADQARARLKAEVAALKRIDRVRLTGMDQINYDTVLYDRTVSEEGARRFHYGAVGDPSPYLITQAGGAYRSVPAFLTGQHKIETAEDAEAYLGRLEAYGSVLDQETERFGADVSAGVIPPDFLLDKTLAALSAQATDGGGKLVTDLVTRTGAKGIPGAWGDRAAAVAERAVKPALARQLAAVTQARAKATHEAGIRRLPDGEAYYAWAIAANTTTRMQADEIHKLGLKQVAEATARADELLTSQGFSQGTVGARLGALNADPRFHYAETDAGRAQLMAYVQQLLAKVNAQMPRYFSRFPKYPVEVKPSPPWAEAGSPGAYYQAGPADGSKPGTYFVNLRLVGASPSWQLPTITYHEANPGHHHQISLAREAQGVHPIRREMEFSAYSEGWAVYCEQLADEMGLYADDPFGKIGYYRSRLFRAARLVVDTGLHHLGWSREQAIAYLVGDVGMSERGMISEVERYCTSPGQACAYRIGTARWLDARSMAQAKLGAKFDIRAFHDTAMLSGAMPLDVFYGRMSDWANAEAKA
jgi:uncharacterized protein (DUF885 family)